MHKRSINKKSILLILAVAANLLLLLFLVHQGMRVMAQEPQLGRGPTRSESVGSSPVINGHGTGYRAPRMDLFHLTGQAIPKGFFALQSPPASWDWRAQGKVTSVKDQGSCGSCWAFATLGNMESKMLIDIPYSYDFSENSVKEYNYEEVNDIGGGNSCSGGNYFISANYLSQKGTVLEACNPYVAGDTDCISTCTYQKTLIDWRIICGSVVPDTSVLKTYIQTYGPVYTSMYASFPAFSTYDGSYTTYWPGTQSPNHAVLIVGWDDSLAYDKGGGQTGYGAWIVRNSWGTNWGGTCGYGSERGYFTIAYGSASIGKNSSFIYGWQNHDDNGDLLYYDECGWGTYIGQGDGTNPTAWGMCKFVPLNASYVKNVEFWTADVTTDIDVYIYDTFSDGALTTLLASKQNSSFTEAGYHSIRLDSPLAIDAGNDIYTVVKITDSIWGFPIVADDTGPVTTEHTYASITGDDGTWGDAGVLLDCDVAIRVRTWLSLLFSLVV